MATVIDLLRQLGQHAGPDGGSALCGPLVLPAQPVAPLASGLPGPLVDAWSVVTGRPTTADHALARAASRSGKPVVFSGRGTAPRDDLLLLLVAQLIDEPSASALWLAADARAARTAGDLLARLAPSVGLSWQAASLSGRGAAARLLVATYDELHRRLLPFADRGWRWLWSRLSVLALPDLQCTTGTRGEHLGWLIRRAERRSRRDLRLFGALAAIAETGEVAPRFFGRAVRLVESQAGPPEPALITLWRCTDRVAALAQLASALRARRLSVTILGRDPHETGLLQAALAGMPEVEAGRPSHAAPIAIVSGVPTAPEERDALMRRGYRLLVMLAADEPHELLFAAEMDRLLEAPPGLPMAPPNPYIANGHLQCAAGELPLSREEIDRWQARDLAEQLTSKGALCEVSHGLLQPGHAAVEYAAAPLASMLSAKPFAVRDPHGDVIAYLLPAVADWRGLPGTSWAGNLVVAHRSDDPPLIDLAVDDRRRIALPRLTFQIAVRDDLGSRKIMIGSRTVAVSRSKVRVHQRVDGLLEYTTDRSPVALKLAQPLHRTWTAFACSIPLPSPPPEVGSPGWSIAAALPLVVRVQPEDIVVAYDSPARSLWLIETEPGGTGISDRLMADAERLLQAAYALAQAAAQHALYGHLARAELGWLLPLYQADPAPEQPAAPVAAPAPAVEPGVSRPAATQPVPGVRRTRVYQVVAGPAEPDVEPAAGNIEASDMPSVDDIQWAVDTPDTAEDELEDISWAPDVAPEAEGPPVRAAASTPRPSREAASLNAPRRPPRYPAARPPRVERNGSIPRPPTSPRTSPRSEGPAPRQSQSVPASENQSPRADGKTMEGPVPTGQDQGVDVGAMIARMRRLREEREREQARTLPRPTAQPARTDRVILRFQPGHRVRCVPYGEGVVRQSRLVGGREQLTVEFPDHGAIEVDPAVSAVRLLEPLARERPEPDGELP